MSKAVSKLFSQSVQNSRAHSAFGSRNAPVSNYFITDNNNQILNKTPGLRFKSGGWQEDNKKWGLLWTIEGNIMPNVDMCFKQKLVKVTTKTGERVMAITYDTN